MRPGKWICRRNWRKPSPPMPQLNPSLPALPYSHQKEYADHVAEAKRPETRQRRAANAVDLLLEAEAKGLTPRYRRSRS